MSQAKETRTIANVVDGKLNGPFATLDAYGQPIMQTQMRDGKLEGAMTLFRPDGTPERQLQFRNGKLHGTTTIYDNFGRAKHVQFNNGEHQETQISSKLPWHKRLLKRLGLGDDL